MDQFVNRFTQTTGAKYPIIGGPMYPCSNPELVAAISEAGGMGVIQPLSLTYVHGYDFVEGVKYIQSKTDKPLGFNALIEKTSKKYQQRMTLWIEQALDLGIRFFITSLGKPDWVVERVHAVGGLVYHDVTERKWAQIGVDCGVDGLICVNNRAGGHCGGLTAQALYEECASFDIPLVCAGGIADFNGVQNMLDIGYQACQLGTRFIASEECKVSDSYKQAVVNASDQDIITTEKMTGVPVSIIKPTLSNGKSIKVGGVIGWMLRSQHFKHLARIFLNLRAMMRLKKVINTNQPQSDYWQAGKSVAGIHSVLSTKLIIHQLMNKD